MKIPIRFVSLPVIAALCLASPAILGQEKKNDARPLFRVGVGGITAKQVIQIKLDRGLTQKFVGITVLILIPDLIAITFF